METVNVCRDLAPDVELGGAFKIYSQGGKKKNKQKIKGGSRKKKMAGEACNMPQKN